MCNSIMADVVTCLCKKCSTRIGQLPNIWNVVGEQYLIPADIKDAARLAVEVQGAVRPGIAATLFDKW